LVHRGFGLIRDGAGLKIFGAGIVSSPGESRFALDDPSPNRVAFDLRRVMRTRYRIDDFQQTYFVIDSFEDLLRQTLETDFGPLYRELESVDDLDTDTVLDTDGIIHRGTQVHAAGRG
jgi:phenylalanine-4-hydroxylase